MFISGILVPKIAVFSTPVYWPSSSEAAIYLRQWFWRLVRIASKTTADVSPGNGITPVAI
jgi:hypothetical protein